MVYSGTVGVNRVGGNAQIGPDLIRCCQSGRLLWRLKRLPLTLTHSSHIHLLVGLIAIKFSTSNTSQNSVDLLRENSTKPFTN